MEIQDEDDPTIIVKMIDDFRGNSNAFKRPSMLLARQKTNDTDTSVNKRAKIVTPKKESNPIQEAMSPWEIRRVKAEIADTRTQLISAEERISRLEGLRIETELLYSKEKKITTDALQNERKKVIELEKRIEFIRNREAEAIEHYNRISSNEENKNLLQTLADVQKENLQLKENLYEKEKENEFLIAKEKTELTNKDVQLDTAIQENNFQKTIIEDLKNQLSEKNHELRKLEMEQTKLINATKRVKDLEYEKGMYEEKKSLVQSQYNKLSKVHEMERELQEAKAEVQSLKSSISNSMYLEQLVEDLKEKEKKYVVLDEEYANIQSKYNILKTEAENWNRLAMHFGRTTDENSKPRTRIKNVLDDLTKNELNYVSKIKNLEIRIAHAENNLLKKEMELELLKKDKDELKASQDAMASNIKRLKKQLSLISWERDDLRSIIDSYQKETTINSEMHNQFDALEKVIDGYKERIQRIEQDHTLAITGVPPKNYGSNLEINELKKENKCLQDKVQELSDQLEYRNLKGDFDVRNTKIICLKSNPTAEAMANYEDKLTKANEEIGRLKERIKVIIEGNSQDVSKLVEERFQADTVKEINDLKERSKQMEIQNQRLCEIFKKRTQDVREAMNLLFGYRIDIKNNKYYLRNQYAFNSDDFLIFQLENNVMQFLESPYSSTLDELIDLHIKQYKSIPLFLSSLTVDLFKKQTTNFTISDSTLIPE